MASAKSTRIRNPRARSNPTAPRKGGLDRPISFTPAGPHPVLRSEVAVLDRLLGPAIDDILAKGVRR